MVRSAYLLCGLMVFAASACAQPIAQAAPAGGVPAGAAVGSSPGSGGVIRAPAEGDFLSFCSSPHLDVTIKFSAPQHSSSMEMGTGRLAAGTSNFGRHTVDEIIYFVSGRGFATVGEERRPVSSGSSMFVPEGVRHGFESTGPQPLEFVWTTSPAGFVEGIKSVAKPSLEDCSRASR